MRKHELKRHEALHETAPDGVVRWGGIRSKKLEPDVDGALGGDGQVDEEVVGGGADGDGARRKKRARVAQEADVPVIDPELGI